MIRKKNKISKNQKYIWKVRIVDTGLNTQTGGRIKKIKKFINEENFFL